MPPPRQFRGRDVSVGLGSRQGAKGLMDVQYFHGVEPAPALASNRSRAGRAT